MTTDTLTITNHIAHYSEGYVFITLETAETCILDLLYTQRKPTRHRNPAIQEPGFRTHRWLFTMKEVVRINSILTLPATVHTFVFKFPERNDTIYYTGLIHDVPDTTSPQAPIFACRLKLKLIYSTLWPGYTDFPPEWDNFEPFWPGATINNGTATMKAIPVTQQTNSLFFFPDRPDPPITIPRDKIFVLFDATYFPINNEYESRYFLHVTWSNPVPFLARSTIRYGAVNFDPCVEVSGAWFGNFDPTRQWLFCLDLMLLPPDDDCGYPAPTNPDSAFWFIELGIVNQGTDPSTPRAASVVHPFAIYQLDPDLEDISNRWKYLPTLLPQKSTPRLLQRP